MKLALLTYKKTINKWVSEESEFSFFIEALFTLAQDFDCIGWSYFEEEMPNLIRLIEKQYQENIPEMVTFGSELFLDNTEFLEPTNVFFSNFSRTNENDYDSWRCRVNAGYISSQIVECASNYKFPEEYKVALSVLSYFTYRIGGITRVVNLLNFDFKKVEGLSEFEYLSFISYTKKKKWLLYYAICRLIFDKKSINPTRLLFRGNYKVFKPENIWNINKEFYKEDITIVDAFIPTVGRPSFVYQVLKDMDDLNIKIRNFILVEQVLPGQEGSLLKDVLDKKWNNFIVKHILLDQLGLCNARNIGLQSSDADYVIMLDDDIRVLKQPDLLRSLVNKLETAKADVISFATNNRKGNVKISLSNTTSGGASLIKKDHVELFSLEIEGMGSDDQEYNLKIHEKGKRVLYTNEEFVDHLKAPMGGWRFDAKKYLPWFQDDKIEPLPGPATLYRYLIYGTKNQLKGFKFFTFHKYYGYKFWKINEFNKRWNKSLNWAEKIAEGKVSLNIKKGIIKKSAKN